MSSVDGHDFLIVGGGTAGLVLAKRLSEDGRFSVHVLESGETLSLERQDVAMPVMAFNVLSGKDLTWSCVTSPQPELNGRKVEIPTGRVLGGSSNVNFSIWLRGDAAEYDRIAEIAGDPTWTFQALMPYFKRSETYHYPDGSHSIDRRLHGDSGPIHVLPRKLCGGNKWRDTTAKAFEEAGFVYKEDANDGQVLGFGDLTTSNCFPLGGRQSSLTYMADKPPKLHISEQKTVSKVIFQEKKAIGVETTNGERYFAKKEVIICAGALRSPAILQLSGIGSHELLSKLGIPVICELPGVGENFWDHPIIHLRYRLKEKYASGTVDDVAIPKRLEEEMALYAASGKGLLSGLPVEFSAWANFCSECKEAVDKDTSLSAEARAYILSPKTAHTQFFVAYAYAMGLVLGPDSHISILPQIMTPTSRGSVRICSSDPAVEPVRDPHYMSTDVDKALMRAAVKLAGKMMEGPVWSEFILDEVQAIQGMKGFSDEVVERRITECTDTVWHYGGTCAMAAQGSKELLPVVNSHCEVYGVQSLRVVDASVFPIPISANTQASVYALAEKISDVILKKYSV